jgi:hypothetical protein
MPTPENEFLHELEVEVEAELGMTESSHPEEELELSPADWQFDPTDVVREQVGLRSVLGAVEALESDARFSHSPDAGTGIG